MDGGLGVGENWLEATQPGMAEVREYVIRAMIKDAEIGQMSDIASVTFGG